MTGAGRLGWVLVACVASAARPALARDDVDGLRLGLANEKDPARRIELMPRIGALGGPAAAKTLAKVVADDPEASVRVAAADALGRIDAENALALLLERAAEGGPRAAREAVARSLARRPEAASAVLRTIDDLDRPEIERALLLSALAAFHDPTTREALVARARAGPPGLRDAALRTLAARRDAPGEVRTVLGGLLRAAQGREATLQVLDAVEPALDPAMRPVLERLVASVDAPVRDGAAYLLERLRSMDAPAGGGSRVPGRPEGRYAPGDDGPPPTLPVPTPRSRVDLVYVLDATGSTVSTIDGLRARIADETVRLVRRGGSVRVGVVAFRGGRGADARRAMQVLLPSFDPVRVAAFLRDVDAGGVDSRGAAVSAALSEALDRMPWRWTARREVQLFADSGCDDARAAGRTVSLHLRSDATLTRVAYVLRTRSRIPAEYDDLARLGGTGAPEGIR